MRNLAEIRLGGRVPRYPRPTDSLAAQAALKLEGTAVLLTKLL